MHSKGVPLWTRLYTFQRRFLRGRIRSIPVTRAYRAARRKRGEAPTAETPYVYLPLHLQPEATTSPMGGVFTDQYLALETLVRALPPPSGSAGNPRPPAAGWRASRSGRGACPRW
jgi:hypothetical protein